MGKTVATLGILATILATSGRSEAVVNAPVSIAYPISGSANDNYFKVSFTATCPGGSNVVRWGFDGVLSIGQASFYDNFNTQFLHKLPTGWHTVDVVASCGQEHMKFYVN
jgi:hypothetical protein